MQPPLESALRFTAPTNSRLPVEDFSRYPPPPIGDGIPDQVAALAPLPRLYSTPVDTTNDGTETAVEAAKDPGGSRLSSS
ncbi:MAG: hypothetical protein SPI77_03015 [Corynebacterium sp.]|nr:hypothetical protein [Corynebacterium sp.]